MHERRANPIECFAIVGYNVNQIEKKQELVSESSFEDYYSATDALDVGVDKSIDEKKSLYQMDGQSVTESHEKTKLGSPLHRRKEALKKDHPISDRVYAPSLLWHYPDTASTESQARNLPKHIEIFCFPRGIKLLSSEKEPQASWHSFVMTDEKGERIYGVSAIIYMSLATSPPALEHFKRQVSLWRESYYSTEEIEFYHANQSKIAELEHSIQKLKEENMTTPIHSAEGSIVEIQELIRLYGQLIDQTFHPLTFLLDGSKVWLPLCLTFLSHEPYFGLLKNCISVLHLYHLTQGSDLSAPQPSHLLVQVLEELPCAPSGKIEIQIPILLPDSVSVLNMYYSRPPLNRHPMLLDLPIYPIFLCLSLPHLILVYERVLAEGRIILLSNNRNLLVSVAESLMAFLWPFYWLHVYIPLLPKSALSTLCAPVPYLIGLETAASEPETNLEIWRALKTVDGLIVCLDEDSLIDQSQDVGPLRHYLYEEESEESEVNHSQSYLAYHNQNSLEIKKTSSHRSVSIYSNHSTVALKPSLKPKVDIRAPSYAFRLPSHTRKKLLKNLKKTSAELQLLKQTDYKNNLYDSLTLLHPSVASDCATYTPLLPRKCPLDLLPSENFKKDKTTGQPCYSPSLHSASTRSSALSTSPTPTLSGASSLTKVCTRSELSMSGSLTMLTQTGPERASMIEEKKSPFKKFLKKTKLIFNRRLSLEETDVQNNPSIRIDGEDDQVEDESAAADEPRTTMAVMEGHVFIDFPTGIDLRWAMCSLCCRSLSDEPLFVCRRCGLVKHATCHLPEKNIAFTICDFHAKHILSAFLKIFTELFRTYRKFLLLPPDGDDLLKVSDLDTLFDKKKFIAETASSKDRKSWLTVFLETQMFNQFSYERAVTNQLDYGSLYFDEIIKEKVNRSIVKFQKDKIPFLKDQTYSIQSTISTPLTNFKRSSNVAESSDSSPEDEKLLFYPLLGRFRKESFLPPRNVQMLIDDFRLVSDYKLYTLTLNRNCRLNQWKKKKKNARLLEMNVSSLSSSTCSLDKKIPIFDLKMDSFHSSVYALLQKYRAYESATFGIMLSDWSALRSSFLDCHADLIHLMNDGIVDKSRIVEIKYLLGLAIDHITRIDSQLLLYQELQTEYLQDQIRKEWVLELPNQIMIHYM